jgi:hypothetical protein
MHTEGKKQHLAVYSLMGAYFVLQDRKISSKSIEKNVSSKHQPLES